MRHWKRRKTEDSRGRLQSVMNRCQTLCTITWKLKHPPNVIKIADSSADSLNSREKLPCWLQKPGNRVYFKLFVSRQCISLLSTVSLQQRILPGVENFEAIYGHLPLETYCLVPLFGVYYKTPPKKIQTVDLRWIQWGSYTKCHCSTHQHWRNISSFSLIKIIRLRSKQLKNFLTRALLKYGTTS